MKPARVCAEPPAHLWDIPDEEAEINYEEDSAVEDSDLMTDDDGSD